MNNYELELQKILENFYNSFKNFNIKNLGLNILEKLKIKFNKKIFLLQEICEIKILEKKIFLLIFNDLNILKNILKNNYLENYGFQILKKKNNIELKIPTISKEFRIKILNILKNEYEIHKNLLEYKRKNILFLIKNKNKNKDEIERLEKILEKNNLKYKLLLKTYFDKFSLIILNE